VVREVRVVEDAGLLPGFVASRLETRAGEPLDFQRLERDLGVVYGLGLYERVGYHLLPTGDGGEGTVLEIAARKKRFGPSYLEAGLNLSDDFKGASAFNLALRLNTLAINRRGGELITDLRVGRNQLLRTELNQPLSLGQGLFVAPRLQLSRDPARLLFPGLVEGVIDTRFSAAAAGLDLGQALAHWGELRLGYEFQSGTTEIVGRADVASGAVHTGRVYLHLAADTLDSGAFPRRGLLAQLEITRAARGLGGEEDYTVAGGSFLAAASRGRQSLTGGLELGSTLTDQVSVVPFAIGGFTRLSGLGESRLFGEHLALAKLIYTVRLNQFSTAVLDAPFYLGASFEAGNTWLSRDDARLRNLLFHGSAFVAYDSAIGPLYLGYGRGEHGAKSLFLFLGRPF
jgi:NTE family protein